MRKRVIKILKDICINQPDFSKIDEICVKIMKRINDEEGIKVCLTCSCIFYCIRFLTHMTATGHHSISAVVVHISRGFKQKGCSIEESKKHYQCGEQSKC